MIPLGNAYLWEIANEFAIAQKRQWAGEMSMEALRCLAVQEFAKNHQVLPR